MSRVHCLLATLAALAVATVADPAIAHHAMGGDMPKTLWQGLASGLAHPVIGLDHLAFIIAIGIAAGLIGRGGATLVVAFVAASTAGVVVHLAKLDMPIVEILVALSVVVAGLLLASGAKAERPVWLPFATLAGLAHGYAFGESVVGAEQSVIGAYLVGLAIVAVLMALGVALLTRRFMTAEFGGAGRARLAGGAVGCIGLAMLALNLVGT